VSWRAPTCRARQSHLPPTPPRLLRRLDFIGTPRNDEQEGLLSTTKCVTNILNEDNAPAISGLQSILTRKLPRCTAQCYRCGQPAHHNSALVGYVMSTKRTILAQPTPIGAKVLRLVLPEQDLKQPTWRDLARA
jgi:hypothetical protein